MELVCKGHRQFGKKKKKKGPARLTCLCVANLCTLRKVGVRLLANDVIEKLLKRLGFFVRLCKQRRIMSGGQGGSICISTTEQDDELAGNEWQGYVYNLTHAASLRH